MTINASSDKELRQIFKGYSFLNNQTLFRLGELIHNKDRIKMLRFAKQTHNSRELYVSPFQSTYQSDFISCLMMKFRMDVNMLDVMMIYEIF